MHDQRIIDGTIFRVNHFMLHPMFMNHTVYDDYDMALITVSGRIRFTRTIKPICLPAVFDDFTGQTG